MHSFNHPDKKIQRVFQSLEYHIQSHKGKKDHEWLGITSRSSWLKHKLQASQWQGVYLVLTLEPLRKILWGQGSPKGIQAPRSHDKISVLGQSSRAGSWACLEGVDHGDMEMVYRRCCERLGLDNSTLSKVATELWIWM